MKIFADNCVHSGAVTILRQARIENLWKETIIQRVLNFFSKFKERNLRGKLFIIDISGRIRIWPK